MLIEVYQMTAAISIHSLVKRETDDDNGDDEGRSAISIHSLVKRETELLQMQVDLPLISIQSLVKRETHEAYWIVRENQIFQSTPS